MTPTNIQFYFQEFLQNFCFNPKGFKGIKNLKTTGLINMARRQSWIDKIITMTKN